MKLLRVTDIIAEAGLMPTGPWYDQAAMDRGTDLHEATTYIDDGDLDWSSLHPVVAAKAVQYQRFLSEMQVEVLMSEFEVVDAIRGYVGHADRLVRINGKAGVVDIKPSSEPWHQVQLAAYAMAACADPAIIELVGKKCRRWNLVLTAQRYKLIERTERSDWTTFLAALTVAKFRRDHGLARE